MSETEQQMISSVLSFLAENVNLYNWHLLRSPNPNRYMYDETEEAMCKLYYKLFERAEENNEVKLKLKNTVLKLSLTDDEEEDNNNSARLLSNFIQNRQRDLYLHNHPESERDLWFEYSYFTNDLYTKLHKLEMIYMDILSYDSELRKSSYNEEVMENDLCPLLGGSLEIELEKVYLSNHMVYYEEEDQREEQREAQIEDQREIYYEQYYEQYYEEYYEEYTDDEDDNVSLALKIVDTNIIMEFDCPICFELQKSGSKCVTTTCEHQYCAPCFESMMQRKAVCAMCRGKISEYIVSIVNSNSNS
jgi:hypothetical protein